MGNLRSVQKKFNKIGFEAEISNDPSGIAAADKLVLPGVGHFYHGVKKIKELGIWDVLNESVLEKKVPILGICLGMQLMAKSSAEGNAEGLGWFDAEVFKFQVEDKLKFKVPHMGWNNTLPQKENILYSNLNDQSMFYFVHSYYMKCNNPEDVLTTTGYENQFVSAIQKDNIYGTQFHPEKSHDDGDILIKNFVELT